MASATPATRSSVHTHVAVARHDLGGGQPGAEVSGSIVSLGTGSIVVQDAEGFWRTIVLGTGTTYSEGPLQIAPAASASDLSVGSEVTATGTVDPNHTSLDATTVRIELATLRGTVQTMSTGSIVITGDWHAPMKTIDLSPQTVVFTNSGVVTISSVSVGSVVEGFGTLQSDGSLAALYLAVGEAHSGSDHQSGFGGFGLPNRYGPNHYGRHGQKR